MTKTIEDILNKLEPDTPPSQRYNRMVNVEAARVLELRDPNDGQNPDPASKSRHQFVLTTDGGVWRRRLPPESVGDEWQDTGAPRWEPVEQLGGVLLEVAPLLPAVRCAVVCRQRMQVDGEDVFVICGETVAAEGRDVELRAGPITGSWWAVPLPPCPDCGGDLVWFEAGYVPGTRRCLGQPIKHKPDGRHVYDIDGGCGSFFTVGTR